VAARYGMDPVIHPLITWPVIGWAAGIVFVMAAVMAVYPSLKASRLRPVEALRHA
jgi:ABC-type antimicrobial peptide transport system permease subunit